MTDPTPTRDEAVPSGWKLVPAEATKEMLAALRHEAQVNGYGSRGGPLCYAAMLASAPAPASGGVDAVARAIWNHLHYRHGGDYDGAEGSTARADTDCLARKIVASLSPAATPVSEAEPVANDCPNCGCSGIVNIDRDDDDNCPECSGTGDEPSTCYNTGLHCLAGCDGKTCIGANLPLNRWPAQALAKPASSPAGRDVREFRARAIYEAMGFAYEGRTVGSRGPFGEWATALKAADAIAALSQSTSAGRVGE